MRKLFYVPILPSSADFDEGGSDVARKGLEMFGPYLWREHLRTIDLFWNSIGDYLNPLNVNGFRVYQESLVVGGKFAEKIVRSKAKKGSRNYTLIYVLMRGGAVLMQTENPLFLEIEADYVSGLLESKNVFEKAINYLKYELNKRSLLYKRDSSIAGTINQTLGDGETGVLFLRPFHGVLPKLAKDILVEELKEREKVARYQKKFYSKKPKAREIKELQKYLAAPVKGWSKEKL